MKKLHEDPKKYYNPKERPSGTILEKVLQKIMVGLPPTEIPNTESNSSYIQLCKAVSTPAHPARFPRNSEFFIKF